MIDKNMSLLDIVYSHPESEAIFHTYDEVLGRCLLCDNLFDSLKFICTKYGLNETELLEKLNVIIKESK